MYLARRVCGRVPGVCGLAARARARSAGLVTRHACVRRPFRRRRAAVRAEGRAVSWTAPRRRSFRREASGRLRRSPRRSGSRVTRRSAADLQSRGRETGGVPGADRNFNALMMPGRVSKRHAQGTARREGAQSDAPGGERGRAASGRGSRSWPRSRVRGGCRTRRAAASAAAALERPPMARAPDGARCQVCCDRVGRLAPPSPGRRPGGDPRWARILPIAARCRIGAKLFSSPAPQLGPRRRAMSSTRSRSRGRATATA
jgi:hypothetical protein